MNKMKWKKPLETGGDPLQDHNSDVLKRVDKRMPQWPLETVGVRSNSENKVMRDNILTPLHKEACAGCVKTRVSEHEIHELSNT